MADPFMQLRAELTQLNPALQPAPAGFDGRATQWLAQDVMRQLQRVLGPTVTRSAPDTIQDATFFAMIQLPMASAAIRLSCFGSLVVIVGEEHVPPGMRDQIDGVLTAYRLRRVPFGLFGDSWATLPRFDGGLFQQLFDYL